MTYQPLDKSVDEYGKIPIQHIQVNMRFACFRLKANLSANSIFQNKTALIVALLRRSFAMCQ